MGGTGRMISSLMCSIRRRPSKAMSLSTSFASSLPGQSLVRGDLFDLGRKQIGPTIGLQVDDVRNAATKECAPEHANRPTWMRRHVPAQAQVWSERKAEACARVGFAIGAHRHVGRESGASNALDQTLDRVTVR